MSWWWANALRSSLHTFCLWILIKHADKDYNIKKKQKTSYVVRSKINRILDGLIDLSGN